MSKFPLIVFEGIDGTGKTYHINKIKNFDWTLQTTSPAEVLFSVNTQKVYDTQKVKISFFVVMISFKLVPTTYFSLLSRT